MVWLFFLIFALCCLASISNYMAYTYIRQYKYMKLVKSMHWKKALWGALLGLPYVFMPFVLVETDREFTKYKIIRQSIYLARFFSFLFFVASGLRLFFWYL